MNKVLNEDRFFSMTWDYLHVHLPTQHHDSPKTAKSYEDGLTIFRRYLTDTLSVSIADFLFEDLYGPDTCSDRGASHPGPCLLRSTC